MRVLKDEFVKLVEGDSELQGKIAAYNNKAPQSVLRWAKANNQKLLTSVGSLQAIAEYTRKSVKSLTKEVKEVA